MTTAKSSKVPCKARVWDRHNPRWPREVACKRSATRDGYCTQHHPDTIAARHAAADAEYARQAAIDAAKHRAHRVERYILSLIRQGAVYIASLPLVTAILVPFLVLEPEAFDSVDGF